MNIEAHKRALKESLDEIKDAVQAGIERKQRTIGFHCSAAAVDMFELWLHQEGLIDPGTTIKHDIFTSFRKAEEKLPAFDRKNEILKLMVGLEGKRNALVYGKAQTKDSIEDYIGVFNRLKEMLFDMGVEYE